MRTDRTVQMTAAAFKLFSGPGFRGFGPPLGYSSILALGAARDKPFARFLASFVHAVVPVASVDPSLVCAAR